MKRCVRWALRGAPVRVALRGAPVRVATLCAAVIAATACATIALTPQGQEVVPVTLESENSSSATAAIGGCRLVATHESVDLTELDLANEIPPFVRERNRAAAGGANVLLARTRVLVPRGFECPAASPITDCPPLEGAWVRVSFEDYRCPDDATGPLRKRASD